MNGCVPGVALHERCVNHLYAWQPLRRWARLALNSEADADFEVSDSRYGQSPERCDHVNGGSSMHMRKSSVVGSILVTSGVVVAVSMLPDLVRYLKIRAM
jgi:hypothetical protein